MSQGPEVAVIGGSGFIGSRLVESLANRGSSVRVLSRSGRASGRAPSSVRSLRGDVRNPEDVAAAIEGTHVVYHLAAGAGNCWRDFEQTIVQGTRLVAQSCLEHRVDRLVYVSSIAALYLGARGCIDERVGPDPKAERRSHYSRAKILAERVLQEMHTHSNLPVVILRPGVVVGPGGMISHGGLGTWASDTCCAGWGRGRHPLPFVLVSDVVEALAKSMEASAIEGMTFNLVGDVRPSAVEFVNVLRSRSRRNFRFYPQSLWKMQMIEAVKWMLKVVANKPENPFPSYRDLVSRSLRSQFDCSAAKEKLGWSPNLSLEVFLAEAIDSQLPSIHPRDLRRDAVSA